MPVAVGREEVDLMRVSRLAIILLCFACVAAGCAKVPITGRRQFLLITEAEEILSQGLLA